VDQDVEAQRLLLGDGISDLILDPGVVGGRLELTTSKAVSSATHLVGLREGPNRRGGELRQAQALSLNPGTLWVLANSLYVLVRKRLPVAPGS
jgi:hypothetical protein